MRIRRRGRHTAPSQVEKVAEKAGKAAPAVAIAGALVAVPQAQHAIGAAAKQAPVAAADARRPAAAQQQSARTTLDAVTTHSVLVSGAAKARHAAAGNTSYKVRAGDTLSGIAERYYHNAADWQWLYHENSKTVSDPNLIYPGETLLVPADPPAHYTPSGYVPRHAKPAAPTVHTTSSSDADHDGDSGGADGAKSGGGSTVVRSAHHGGGSGGTTPASGGSGGLSGTLSCSGLQRLWDSAGGNPAHAFMAAEIAMAESGGDQYAHSPTNDFGYWQINGVHGALATYDAYGNARAAIAISSDGTNWFPWTTYTSGAYAGRC